MIAFGRTGILDDDISKYLCHGFLSANFTQTIPTIRVFRVYKIKGFHDISGILKVSGCTFVQFRFWIGDDEAFPAGNTLEDHVACKGPAFHGTAGTVNGNIPVHAGILRETNGFSVQFSKNGSLVFLDIIRKLQYLMHFLQSHKTGSPIGSLCGIIQVPAPVCYFPVSVKSHTHEKEGQESKSCQT